MDESTRMRKHTREEATVNEDPFNRLPDDLVTCIISRLVDLKYLCHCSIVSKRFASLIPQTQNVSLVVTSSEKKRTKDSYSATHDLLLTLRLAHSFEKIPEALLPSLQKVKLPMFLEKFCHLKTIFIQYEDEVASNNISLFPMWKAKFSDSPMIESLVTIMPSLTYNYKESEEADLENVLREFSPNFNEPHTNIALWLAMQSCMEWLCLIWMLVRAHTSLKSVTIRDAFGRGKVVLMDEQLVNMRNSVKREDIPMILHARYKRIPIVRLPKLGCVLRDVLIFIFNFSGELSANADVYEEILSWDFDANEKILSQALEDIFKNYGHKFFRIQKSDQFSL